MAANYLLKNCPYHPNEQITLYCRGHGKLGCLTCMTVSHQLCKIDEVANVSENFLEDEEYANYEQLKDELNETCGLNISKLDKDIAKIEAQAMTFMQENVNPLKSLKEQYQSIAEEIGNTESLTSDLKRDRKYDLLYCEIKQNRERISEFQAKTYEMAISRRVQECKYEQILDLQTKIKSQNVLGTLEVEAIKLGPCNKNEALLREPVRRINIKANGDKKACYATGMAFVSCDQLAVADKANINVKIIDLSRDKIISEIPLSSRPRDITAIPPDQLAVTLRDEKLIQLLSTVSGLAKLSQIKTEGCCRGIHYDNNNGNLIVTFDKTNPRIEVLNLKGESLSSCKCNREDESLFKEPKCIGFSPDASQMYVTDLNKKSIYRLSKEREVLAYAQGYRFMGVAVSGRGSVFATSKLADLVVQFEDDLTNGRVVLNNNDGIKGPIALVVDHARNMLFVSCGGRGGADICDKLHVFRIELALLEDASS